MIPSLTFDEKAVILSGKIIAYAYCNIPFFFTQPSSAKKMKNL